MRARPAERARIRSLSRSRALLASFSTAVVLQLAACSTPPTIAREAGPGGAIIRAGPFSLAWLRELTFEATVVENPDGSDIPPDVVYAHITGREFDELRLDLDGDLVTFHRPLFQANVVRLRGEEFARIAGAAMIRGSFDRGWGEFTIGVRDHDLLREYARRIGLAEPRTP